jgi:hypothetical protein
LQVARGEAQLPCGGCAVGRFAKVRREFPVYAGRRGDPMGERVLAPHDRRGTQMERTPPLCPQAGVHRLADEQVLEGKPPARRSLLLEQDPRPLGLPERRRGTPRARDRGRIDERAVVPEH